MTRGRTLPILMSSPAIIIITPSSSAFSLGSPRELVEGRVSRVSVRRDRGEKEGGGRGAIQILCSANSWP